MHFLFCYTLLFFYIAKILIYSDIYKSKQLIIKGLNKV